MIILKHRFFWILNLYHLLKEKVFFSKKKDTISANILNVRNDILKILYYQSGTNNFNSIMIAIVLRFPIFNYRIQRRY